MVPLEFWYSFHHNTLIYLALYLVPKRVGKTMVTVQTISATRDLMLIQQNKFH